MKLTSALLVVLAAFSATASSASMFGDIDERPPSHYDFEKMDKKMKEAQIVCGTAGIVPVAGNGACAGQIINYVSAGYGQRIRHAYHKHTKADAFDGSLVTGMTSAILGGTVIGAPIGNTLNVLGATTQIDAERKNLRKAFGLKYSNGNLIEWDPGAIKIEWDNKVTSQKKATKRMKQYIASGLVKVKQ